MTPELTALVARVEGWKLGHLPPDTVIEEVVAQLAAVIRALAGEVERLKSQVACLEMNLHHEQDGRGQR